ncbi:hypothetical protein FOXG_18588 [Fusarium oxysporum f. sp. lycopersici 4287]|uniref:Uncharacterized protein n=2 Tax=Fusarium oxysporum TaxID=5507 RepID=A0A0J9UNQ5_FUSO4|nr:hypothetical protein FOXG_18588 [Fusarium oxysporum f. sp. lycopersici 4287]EXK31310.1 hypothetical protein FOMG_13029 [Fusarium oxysporum f. sp. melonis 26406]KNA99765.1 hypothetical protein FOXG_18588 [Fusarium oxysporum f. sp. lycopersici 4287]
MSSSAKSRSKFHWTSTFILFVNWHFMYVPASKLL